MNELRVRFGNRLRQLRKTANFTQEELSEKAEVSVDFIGLMERGLRGPSFKTLEKLSNALGVDVSALFMFDE